MTEWAKVDFFRIEATEVEGIFRMSGSERRIRELQTIFNSPDRYGKGLDWTGYTVHDAANILRRYLNSLPEPMVPHDFYDRFREPLKSLQARPIGDLQNQSQPGNQDADTAIISTYQQLITELPPLNRQLLLYILDLLAVFSAKSDENRMDAYNLSAIFQPGVLNHHKHDMSPEEYKLSQDVLVFLIQNQDHFLIGMTGTAADEKTVNEVQSGVQPRPPGSPTATKGSQGSLGRSISNTSGGADSVRKFGALRRNVSVSSKNSKHSGNVPSPSATGTPLAIVNSVGGLHRSNTVPSKKSPALSSSRFKPSDPTTPTPAGLSPSGYLAPGARASSPGSKLAGSPIGGRALSNASSLTPTAEQSDPIAASESAAGEHSQERLISSDKSYLQPPTQASQPASGAPTKERKISNLLSRSPASDSDRRETRVPNKLKKKRLPGSTNPSAQSSTNSLPQPADSPDPQAFYTPMPTPGVSTEYQADPMASTTPIFSSTEATPLSEIPPPVGDAYKTQNLQVNDVDHALNVGRSKSPTPSLRSRSTVASQSEVEHTDNVSPTTKADNKSRWTLSSSTKKGSQNASATAPPSQLALDPLAGKSNTSIGSSNRHRKSSVREPQPTGTEAPAPTSLQHSSTESTPSKEQNAPKEKETPVENTERRGPIGWFKAKRAQAKEEKKEREAEKERTKSPPRQGSDRSGSRASLAAVTQEAQTTRGRSISGKSEEKIPEEGDRTPLPKLGT